MIHSPPLSMNRVSVKLSIPQRMAAQLDGLFRPTPVTMPDAMIEIGCILFLGADFLHFAAALGATLVHKFLEGRIPGLAELTCTMPTARHFACNNLGNFKHVF